MRHIRRTRPPEEPETIPPIPVPTLGGIEAILMPSLERAMSVPLVETTNLEVRLEFRGSSGDWLKAYALVRYALRAAAEVYNERAAGESFIVPSLTYVGQVPAPSAQIAAQEDAGRPRRRKKRSI